MRLSALCFILGLLISGCKSHEIKSQLINLKSTPVIDEESKDDDAKSPDTPTPEAPSENPPVPKPDPLPQPEPLTPPVIDTQSPVLRFKNQPSGGHSRTNFEVVFEASDSGSGLRTVTCIFNSSPYSPCTSPVRIQNLGDGNKEFIIRAEDLAGNKSEIVASWLVDLNGPSISFPKRPEASSFSRRASFEMVASNDRSGVSKLYCALDDQDFRVCESSLIFHDLMTGRHTLRSYAEDGLGNLGPQEVYSWEVVQSPGRHYNLGEGNFPDITYHQNQLWVAYQFGQTVRVRNLSAETFYDFVMPQTLAFPRIGVWDNQLHLIYRDGTEGRAVYRNLTRGTVETLDISGGNDVVAVENGFIAWQTNNSIKRKNLSTGETVELAMWRPTGISRILPDGGIRLVDDDRALIAGQTRPCWAGSLSAAERPDDGVTAFLNQKEVQVFWQGFYSYTPRCAENGTGLYAIATWGDKANQGGGVRVVEFP